MSSQVLLNLLDMVRKSLAFHLFSPTHLINLVIQEHECEILFII